MVFDQLKQLATGRDTFARHLGIRLLLKEHKPMTVIDIGGEGRLKLFLSWAKVSAANIRGGAGVDHVIADKVLPFGDGSYEAAVSVDTLEHIPKNDRLPFLREMLRTARKVVVVCAPLGTEQHITHEKEILQRWTGTASDADYLKEHIENGLPTPGEVAAMATELNGKVYYQGDFRRVAGFLKIRLVILSFNVLYNFW